MTTTSKTPATRGMRSTLSPGWYDPFQRLFRNNFMNPWDEDFPVLTTPSINISEEKDSFRVEMAAPGLKKDDFNIDVDGNVLTISCEKETDTGDLKDPKDYSRREYNYPSFSRSFTLPENADVDKVAARYNDGVLNLTIPKKPELQKNKTQKIRVQ